jgi:hypothetical protein
MSKIEVNTIEPQCGTNLTLGASGDTVIIPSGATISNQGTAAGFGPTGAVSWDTTKITADPNPAVTGVGYFADTTSAAFTITLPSSPSAGAVVGIADYANTFATNNLTVDRNGSPIGGVAANATLSTNGVSITLVYVDATQGWIITDSGSRSDVPTPTYIAATGGTVLTCGNCKMHIFTAPGTFCVSSIGCTGVNDEVNYMVIAGGGGGGGQGGGGGAGGFRISYDSPLTASSLTVTASPYPISVGGGGAGSTTETTAGANGSNSIFSTITSAGGGGGGSDGPKVGNAGGSGGGGGWGQAGAAGNTPPVSPPQGNTGGTGYPQSASHGGGGGGGAAAVGGNANCNVGGTGGAGMPTAILGSTPTAPSYGTPGPAPGRYFAGGGGGNANPGYGGGGPGGVGGGGNGADPAGTVTPGTANTGGGAGSKHAVYCSPYTNGNGGSGIVIIRYKYQ